MQPQLPVVASLLGSSGNFESRSCLKIQAGWPGNNGCMSSWIWYFLYAAVRKCLIILKQALAQERPPSRHRSRHFGRPNLHLNLRLDRGSSCVWVYLVGCQQGTPRCTRILSARSLPAAGGSGAMVKMEVEVARYEDSHSYFSLSHHCHSPPQLHPQAP